jgi:hypothetical protein
LVRTRQQSQCSVGRCVAVVVLQRGEDVAGRVGDPTSHGQGCVDLAHRAMECMRFDAVGVDVEVGHQDVASRAENAPATFSLLARGSNTPACTSPPIASQTVLRLTLNGVLSSFSLRIFPTAH